MGFFATDEFHLLWAALLNLAALTGAWRWARRFSEDRLEIAADTGLLYYLVQYLSVCIPGLLGALHPLTMTLVAILLSAGMALAGGRRRRRGASALDEAPAGLAGDLLESEIGAVGKRGAGVPNASSLIANHGRGARATDSGPTDQYAADQHAADQSNAVVQSAESNRVVGYRRARLAAAVLFGAILFILGYIAALLWNQRQLPVLSNDALTYHLPAAVQWLQTGWMGLYPAWFYNPANSYSPLGGSVFMTWLLAPMGNDAMARFVQVGPMILLLIGMINLCRRLGASVGGAALLASAAVLSRPFMSQTILAKDDLFVAAFFVLAAEAMSRPRLEQRTGPWRAGTALGLVLAVKYTVLLSMPILLLMLGRGWNWKRLGIVALCVLALAGPWYLRNWLLVGNPIYPTWVKIEDTVIFPGMLNVHRSDLLATPRGVWEVFTGGYYGATWKMALVMIACWVGGVAASLFRRRGWNRLVRAALIGPIIGIVLFILMAPYGEMRFAYPSLLLLFAGGAVFMRTIPVPAQLLAGLVALGVAAWTTFANHDLSVAFAECGLIAGVLAAASALLWRMRLVRMLSIGCACIIGIMGGVTLMFSYTRMAPADRLYSWQQTYGAAADVWNFAREEMPRGASIAYGNTFFIYPLQGYAYTHRVVYAPSRHDLSHFTRMPAIAEPITGEQIVSRVGAMLRARPDKAQWLQRLRNSEAAYLVVMKQDPARPGVTITPPELTLAREEPGTFSPVFENEAGVVFRIGW